MAIDRTKAQNPQGTSPSAPHSGEDTRDRLMAAATTLFARHGFDGVSVKELADTAGVNVSLVSYHFGGKENLYRACLEQFGKERLALAQRVLQPPQTLEELQLRLKMFIEEMLAWHLEARDTVQMIHRECEKEMPLAPDVFRNTFLKVFETMVAFFDAARKAGIVRQELDPLHISQFIFAGIKHFVQSDKIAERNFGLSISQEPYRRKTIEHLVDVSLFGAAVERKPS